MRWKLAPAALLALGAVLSAACIPPPGGSSLPSRLGSEQGAPGQITPLLPATDLAVGDNQRFLAVLLGPDNKVITNATVTLAFFKVTGPGTAQFRSQTTASYEEALVGKGAYVARAGFDEAGDWGVVLQVQQPGRDQEELRASFAVKLKSATPGVGDAVPSSRTLTGTDPSEIEKFSSARPANAALYRVSIDQALNQHKPLAVLFATPGFCTSQLCGPSLDVLEKLQAQYGDQANFIHVEIYKDGRPNDRQEVVPTVQQWGLTSEPWLFLVGADGRLVDKFEGVIVFDEVQPAVDRLIHSS